MTHSLGVYALEHRLASGAMGEVWAATAGTSRVAVKFLSAADDDARAAFLAEVGTLARLRHPGIVPILDHGVLAESVADGPAAGTPWMATAFVGGGTLDDVVDDLAWSGVRQVLLSILDALGYAHGHGVVHRDLKPANVLLSRVDDSDPGVRLADFGIARVMGAGDPFGGASVGTPVVMSPEQWRSASHRVGPWTDLYALGCLAWRMVNGAWPHGGKGLARRLAHLRGEVRLWSPRVVVPDGLEAWVRTLMAVEPSDRFLFAADAAEALRAMPAGSAPVPPLLREAVARERTLGRRDWRRKMPPNPSRAFPGWGEGVLALRSWPTVGREAERDLAWAVLDAVRADGRPRVVWWEGPAGIGATHMARWFGRAAAREGRAHVLTAGGGSAEGEVFRRLLRRALRLDDVPPGDLEEALAESWAWVGVTDPEVVAESRGALAGQGSARSFLGRWLLARAREWPVVVGVDGAADDVEVLRFFGRCLRSDAPLICLVDAGPRPLPEPWRERGDVIRVPLGPLAVAELGALLDESLPLEAAFRRRLVAAAKGSPGALRRDLGDRLAAGRLRAGPLGFDEGPAPAAGEPGIHPFVGLPEAWMGPLRLAAALSPAVHLQEWADAHDGADAPSSERLGRAVVRFRIQQQLERQGLWSTEGDGIRWVEPEHAAALLRDGAGAEAHGRVAEALARTGQELRAARHLVAAGRVEEGVARMVAWVEGQVALDVDVLAEVVALSEGLPDLRRRTLALQIFDAGRSDREDICALLEVAARAAGDGASLRIVAVDRLMRRGLTGVDVRGELEQVWAACDPEVPADQLAMLIITTFWGFVPMERLRAWLDQLETAPLRPLYRASAARSALLTDVGPPREAGMRLLAAARAYRRDNAPGYALDCYVGALERLASVGELELAQVAAQEGVDTAFLTDWGTCVSSLTLAQIALRRGDTATARSALDQARQERDWRTLAQALDALEWVWALQVGDFALAEALVERLPLGSALQELDDALFRPTVDALRRERPALAERAAGRLWGLALTEGGAP